MIHDSDTIKYQGIIVNDILESCGSTSNFILNEHDEYIKDRQRQIAKKGECGI